MSRINYVVLNCRDVEEKITYDTIEKAMHFFGDLGFFANWALLAEIGETIFLNYQGQLNQGSYEAKVKYPFIDVAGLQNLLWRIFTPFLADVVPKKDCLHRSSIHVESDPEKRYRYYVDMFLVFRGEDMYRKIYSVLKRAADDSTRGKAIYFALD